MRAAVKGAVRWNVLLINRINEGCLRKISRMIQVLPGALPQGSRARRRPSDSVSCDSLIARSALLRPFLTPRAGHGDYSFMSPGNLRERHARC